jgi:hypothetical protein
MSGIVEGCNLELGDGRVGFGSGDVRVGGGFAAGCVRGGSGFCRG